MDALRVRIYNVRFGDAILISIPEISGNGPARMRHILIDVGNAASTEGGINTLFVPVAENILSELKGQPLDLYIMTHEHMDHVQGLPFAEDKLQLKGEGSLKARMATLYAWLTVSSDPNYGKKYPNSVKQKGLVQGMVQDIRAFLATSPEAATPWAMGLLSINSSKTNDCVDYLRSLTAKPSYVHRQTPLNGLHPFNETKLEIWAPEEDTSAYYGRFKPLALGFASQGTAVDNAGSDPVQPPAGVDASNFYELVQMRQSGYADTLLAIDKAANNTSIVLCLEWRGWRLLFPADAELRSWQEMNKQRLLKVVDFLKVGHHGSQNATPPPDLLDKILPKDGKKRYAVVSTYPAPDSPEKDFIYSQVPDAETLEELRTRAEVQSTYGLPDGGYIDYLFESDTHQVTVKKSA